MAPLGLPAAPDGLERLGEHLPGAAGQVEAIAELRVHEAAEFWPAVIRVEDGQDRDLQLGQVDAFEARQRLDSRHGRAN